VRYVLDMMEYCEDVNSSGWGRKESRSPKLGKKMEDYHNGYGPGVF